MTSKTTAIFRNIGLGFLVLFGIISCENDLEDIAVDLTGQKPFQVGDTIFEIISYHKNIDSSRVDNNEQQMTPLYLLGVNSNSVFGAIKSDLITQIGLPVSGVDFGDNAIIDRVVVDIPYFSTRDGDQAAVDPISGLPIRDESGDSIVAPNFRLDSIYGKTDLEYTISIHELGTFLNVLDPEDPTQPKSYYSDKEYSILDELNEGLFLPNRNDTILYVERRYLDGDPSTVDDIDTIKRENSVPTMKFDLDSQFFKERFVDNDDMPFFDNNDNFVRYFRGLYIDAEGFDGSLMNLRAADGRMTIYYTNEEITDEDEGEDLNYNGVEGESDVLVKTKQTMIFSFGGVRTGRYDRDYSGSMIQNALLNPDKVNGETELYVQGAAGSEVIIELFDEETLAYLRQERFLVNEANLVFYLDGNQDEVPTQLFLYKYDYKSFISDYFNSGGFGPDVFGGELEYDDSGNPEKYKFKITDYISQVLSSSDPVASSKLALKNFVGTDNLNNSRFDSIVQDWNYIPKGVVLHGNRPKTNEKRLKLEIFFSK
jgi:hypothetical protein